MTWQTALQLAVSGLSVGSIYALVALALVIPFKASGVLNFAQGQMVTLGPYIGLVLATSLPFPFLAVAPLTGILPGAFGIHIAGLFIQPHLAAPDFTLVLAPVQLVLILTTA